MNSLKLAFNPGPKELSRQTLHEILDTWTWKKLRVLRSSEFCEICNWQESGKPRGFNLHMHEVFHYQIRLRGNSVAFLRSLQFLCKRCHGIVHNGWVAPKLIEQAEQQLLKRTRFQTEFEVALANCESIVEHFCNVNQCRRDDFFRHAEQAAANKRERDRHVWRIDWTTFAPKDVEEFVKSHARDLRARS
jgi:hypothetical protein